MGRKSFKENKVQMECQCGNFSTYKQVLGVIRDTPGLSRRGIAEALGYSSPRSQRDIQTSIDLLQNDKLIYSAEGKDRNVLKYYPVQED
jgi:hypothetical protein